MLAARKKLLDHAKQSAAEALFTTLKKVVQQTGKAAGDLIGNKLQIKLQSSKGLYHRKLQ